MKKPEPWRFLQDLRIDQKNALFSKMANNVEVDVLPVVRKNPAERAEYVHFLDIPGRDRSPLFISIRGCYWLDKSGLIASEVKEVREYDHETESIFYKVLLEYENTVEPNPVLFT